MPNTRRSTGGARARPGPAKGQSTISFASKVSKPGPRLDGKKAVIESGKPATKEIKDEDVPVKVEPEVESVPVKVEPEVESEEEEIEVQEETLPTPEKSEAEVRAEAISEKQIGKYWKDIEALRIAPRVHVDDLSVGEKVLRYFDVSSQYGPCVGIQRVKRWQRAERLGLNPPIEVLAVILQEEQKGNPKTQTAHMDEILNSTAVGAV
ncbi:DNA polymerase delta, subunit 4-domain-containing protein [Plectosphaerella plurivora]|uniref:DNA polymerase delta, subunit 4-domain-containing protein n=1 Tax=Plectosphaerella plurivora TaxID=936078 RepID=A0A9P8VLN7_9PEZI|nr:DNA polymerase delta, subunit 4-domain-containing protein [Plectosphaerella plurivora]